MPHSEAIGIHLHEDKDGAAPPDEPARLTDRRQQLRVFFSADLVNGTAFKSRRPTERFSPKGPRPPWPVRFEEFFHDFRAEFEENVREARQDTPAQSIVAGPLLWKLNGDEVLFNELAYPDDRELFPGLATAVAEFTALVAKYDEVYLPEGMGVRGCIWTAGFPIRNRRVQVQQGPDIAVIESSSRDRDTAATRRDHDTGEYVVPPAVVTDYIGRDMDLGFRLAATTPPGRVCCSLDVAERLAMDPEDWHPCYRHRVHVFHVGWRRLKGIADGNPYPLFWMDVNEKPSKRHPWDDAEDEVSAETRVFLKESDTARCSTKDVKEIAEQLRKQFPDYFIKAYASAEELAADHKPTWLRKDVPEDTDALGWNPDSIAVPPATVPTITLDDINQLQILLQAREAEESELEPLAPVLRDVLIQIAQHPAYEEWLETGQFASTQFVVPRELTFGNAKYKRIGETKALVVDNVLRVKINLCGSKVFITDGLWVHQNFRAFPFSDESDLLLAECARLGWDDWATCVVDPATGAGHNVLRYPGNGARRYGFDINARALGYASINASLNGLPKTRLGINDVRDGLPAVFRQGDAERVLVLANMPLGLAPTPNTLPLSAEGGRFGYERTHEALRAMAELRNALSDGSLLRCLVLTYSVGNLAEDRWIVHEYAKELFGEEHVTWRLNEGEKMWRIAGKKEEDNPMPLTHMRKRAFDPYYVHGDQAKRERVAADYDELADKLSHELGCDHLAYGIIVID
ncbi:MAG TPA: class I SAM-dependent methyltransferase [Actinomycetota bacterium]|nr:class I SAM-dependent methyltransferase [Actinomycetota bacterium]